MEKFTQEIMDISKQGYSSPMMAKSLLKTFTDVHSSTPRARLNLIGGNNGIK
jgi:hypothetical protein